MYDANERIVGSNELVEDLTNENSIRPKWLKEYIGQDKVKEKLDIFIKSSLSRKEPLDHVLLQGPPGLGKTTLSTIIANELGVNIRVTSGPAIERPSDLASILTNLKYGDVLFIDEIHRINRSVEEILYSAMEDFVLDIIVGKGPNAQSIRIDLEKFTLVGATTRSGMLSAPLRDRFGVMLSLNLYEADDLTTIIKRSAGILNIEIEDDAAYEIAKRSRGTPRIANRLLKRVRDYAIVRKDRIIDYQTSKEGLSLLEIDEMGLDTMDKKIVMTMYENFNGGPVGVDTIAASTGIENVTIEDVYEPYLLQIGFLSRTPRGRILTRNAYKHYGLKYEEWMKTDDFDYYLPEGLIAQHPTEKRDHARMLVLDKKTGKIEDKYFYNIIDYLNCGDVLVMNDTRVIPARLFGHRENKEETIEVFILNNIEGKTWECLVRPGKKMKIGTKLIFSDDLSLIVKDIKDDGNRIVEFEYQGIFNEILDKLGNVPLPPYIKEELKEAEDYQTVYSKNPGSVAAPTAGLHFTKELLEKIESKGIKLAYLTLNVGLGTFRPVSVEDVSDHKMHSEFYTISKETCDIINKAHENGNKVIATGTTTIRTLESVYKKCGKLCESSGWTDIFIYPGFKYEVADAMITNFHLPKSTLIMLVAAFTSKEMILETYKYAVKQKYRFFSFGDAMFIH